MTLVKVYTEYRLALRTILLLNVSLLLTSVNSVILCA